MNTGKHWNSDQSDHKCESISNVPGGPFVTSNTCGLAILAGRQGMDEEAAKKYCSFFMHSHSGGECKCCIDGHFTQGGIHNEDSESWHVYKMN